MEFSRPEYWSGFCHFLLRGIFPTQGSSPGLPHCRQTLCHRNRQWFGQKSYFPTRGSLCLQALPPPSGHITSHLEISTSACHPRTSPLPQLLGSRKRCLIQPRLAQGSIGSWPVTSVGRICPYRDSSGAFRGSFGAESDVGMNIHCWNGLQNRDSVASSQDRRALAPVSWSQMLWAFRFL